MRNETTTSVPNNLLDKSGIVCSGACAIHCVLAPIIALASPAIASFFENEWIHIGLLMLLMPIATLAFYRGLKLHKKICPVFMGSIGIMLLFAAIAFEALLKIEIEHLEITLTIVGCIFLISAHIFNIKGYIRLSQRKI